MNGELMALALKVAPSLQVEVASYFASKGEIEKAVTLYHKVVWKITKVNVFAFHHVHSSYHEILIQHSRLKGGDLELALELCFSVENPGLTLLVVYADSPAMYREEINVFCINCTRRETVQSIIQDFRQNTGTEGSQ